MSDSAPRLTDQERKAWQRGISEANRNNIFCHCRHCDREWVDSSDTVPCHCGSRQVEYIACWQFPDG